MKPNKYIRASYKLYDITEGKKELLEETNEEQPFHFISGLGLLLDAFEQQVIDLPEGSDFDFTLAPELAYGPHMDDQVVELDKESFFVDGKFDEENVYLDALIPLQDEEGNRFFGRVVNITDDKVTIDLNNPLAGKTLNFSGKILESREATNKELSQFVEDITEQGECCGGGCSYGNDDMDGDGGCCGGHHHDSGCCCGGEGHDEGECCGGHQHEEGGCCGGNNHEEGCCCKNG